MCGIAGFLGSTRGASGVLHAMCGAIWHRGPDDRDVWADETDGVGLAFVRLAILDLSPAGRQPMASGAGRFVIVFNGEIYNHLDLRKELDVEHAPIWRGRSDTETLLAGFEAWGIKETVARTVGMFAFAVWDRRDRRLTLGRDRAGEKPIYYGWCG
jgi:asparagine synthase (glutamine-hydrolysing)